MSEERRFILRNDFVRTSVQAFIAKLPFDMEIIVKPWRPKRSITQNARLWKLHSLAANYVGCSPEDMHEDMLCKVFGVAKEVRLPSGTLKRIPNRRSSQLDKHEFRAFMDQVEAFYISELGVWLDQEPERKAA